MSDDIILTPQDPTIFVVCDKCNVPDSSGVSKSYYGASFTKREWKKGQTCPNCKGELRIIRKIKVNA